MFHKQYPYCLVWGPLPVISWFFPFIGHLGVCTSDGVIWDFAGPFTILRDAFMVGKPARYLQLEPRCAYGATRSANDGGDVAQACPGTTCAWTQGTLAAIGQGWDAHLTGSGIFYESQWYNILTNNCHCFVAHFLNSVAYLGSSSWNSVQLAAWVFLNARYVGWTGMLKTWLPFCVIVPLGIWFGGWIFVYCYAGTAWVLLLWFATHSFCCWRPQHQLACMNKMVNISKLRVSC